jgi:hypothetical protein
MVAGVLVLSTACGGGGESGPAGRAGGASLGRAESAVTGTPGTAGASTADIARTVATAQAQAAAQAQPAADPCRVVSREEVEAALGLALGPGQPGTGAIGSAECTYRAQSDQTPGTMPNVIVAVFRSRLARTTHGYLRENAPSTATDVPGLGDKAYVFVGSGWTDSREIQALRGDVLVSIQVVGIFNPPVSMSAEEKRSKLIDLARTALSRL